MQRQNSFYLLWGDFQFLDFLLLNQTSAKDLLVTLGYTGWVLGGMEVEPKALPMALEKIKKISLFLHENGMRQFHVFRPKNESSFEAWRQQIPFLDGVVWVSQSAVERKNENDTLSEQIQKEIREAEQRVGKQSSLIFYLPFCDRLRGWHHKKMFSDLCLALQKETTLAFPLIGGHPSDDHLPLHPFFNEMEKELHATRLLPVLNTGSIFQGEGKWPSLCYEVFEVISRQELSQRFCGLVSLVCQWPERNDFLSCNLWIASQLQMKKNSSEALLQCWWKSHHPEVNYQKIKPLLKKIRTVSIELSNLRSSVDERELLVDWLSSSLKIIRLHASHISYEPFQVAIKSFLQDADEILTEHSQINPSPRTWVANIGP